MDSVQSLAKLRPLLFGRVTRVLFGIGTLGAVAFLGAEALGALGASILGFLGVSFLVGGLMANPGCEITALANLLLPRRKRVHFP